MLGQQMCAELWLTPVLLDLKAAFSATNVFPSLRVSGCIISQREIDVKYKPTESRKNVATTIS